MLIYVLPKINIHLLDGTDKKSILDKKFEFLSGFKQLVMICFIFGLLVSRRLYR